MTLREVVRFLMWQVREEQQLRIEALNQTTGHDSVVPPSDVELEKRIEEVQQILTTKGNLA